MKSPATTKSPHRRALLACVAHIQSRNRLRALTRRVDSPGIMTTPSTQLQVEKSKETDAESLATNHMIFFADRPLEAAPAAILLARAAEERFTLIRHSLQTRTARMDHGRAPVAAGHVAAVAADQT